MPWPERLRVARAPGSEVCTLMQWHERLRVGRTLGSEVTLMPWYERLRVARTLGSEVPDGRGGYIRTHQLFYCVQESLVAPQISERLQGMAFIKA
jgi:hypothetical protein